MRRYPPPPPPQFSFAVSAQKYVVIENIITGARDAWVRVTIPEKTENLFHISELLCKLKVYQEVEIPKRGKHSISKDLPFFFFFSLPGFRIFCIFSDGTEYIFSGYMCSLRIMSIK